jgi:type IV pilus assembly protein PilB
MVTATKTRARLGDLLIAHGVITQEQLTVALAAQQRGQQQRLIGEILVELGYATRERVMAAVAEAYGVPFACLVPSLVDSSIRGTLPEAFIQKHGVLPLFRVRDVLTVAVAEPSNLFLVDEVTHAAGMHVQIVTATSDNIYQMIENTYAGAEGGPSAEGAVAEPQLGGELILSDDYDSVYGDWPPEKVASLLVHEAVRSRATAIHMEPDEKVLRIRFSIDDVLHVVMRPPVRLATGLLSAFDEMMGFPNRTPAAQGVQRSARLLVQGRTVQLHMASLGGAFGPRTLVRIVRDDEALRPLEKLGCEFGLLARYRDLVTPMRGLVLVAGPRWSGISTTLYSTLQALDPVRYNICTFETTINFNLPGVSQFSLATCGLADPAVAIARLLAQRPDVLILDCELSGHAMATAVEAALDGCLVLARVGGTDAADAIVRVTAQTPVEGLASALRGILAQRLVRTVCPHCHRPCEPPAGLRNHIAEVFGPVTEYIKGRGCASCARTGLLGRIGLFELIPMEGSLPALVRARADRKAWRAAFRAAGLPSLWVDGINKVRAGITSLDEVMTALEGCPGEMDTADPAAPDRR